LVESLGSHPAMPDEIHLPSWGCDETVLFALVERLSGPSPAAVTEARYRRVEFG
jgi:hypothetical protein